MSSKAVEIGGHQVRFVPATKFKEHTPHKYKEILEHLVQNPAEVAEIRCESLEEAKELQSGFHSSGTGRRLKKTGWKIETTVLLNNTIQIRLTSKANA